MIKAAHILEFVSCGFGCSARLPCFFQDVSVYTRISAHWKTIKKQLGNSLKSKTRLAVICNGAWKQKLHMILLVLQSFRLSGRVPQDVPRV